MCCRTLGLSDNYGGSLVGRKGQKNVSGELPLETLFYDSGFQRDFTCTAEEDETRISQLPSYRIWTTRLDLDNCLCFRHPSISDPYSWSPQSPGENHRAIRSSDHSLSIKVLLFQMKNPNLEGSASKPAMGRGIFAGASVTS